MAAIKGAVVPRLPQVEDVATSQCIASLSTAVDRLNTSAIVFGVLAPVKATGAGSLVVAHGLGRIPVGYFPVKVASGSPTLPVFVTATTTTLTLTFGAAFAGSLWVF
jgi:hypothetical protein